MMRVKRLVAAFRQFKSEYDDQFDKPTELRTKMKFKPPKPSMTDGIQDLFDLFADQFQEDEFKKGVSRSFVKTGCVPADSTLRCFLPYVSESQKGSLSFVPHGTMGEADVKSVLADVKLVVANEHEKDIGNGCIIETFELEESNFADMVLLDDDYEDSGSDSDDDNELINAAIDEF